METIYGKQVDEAIAQCIGQAAMMILDKGEAVTNESLSSAILALSGQDADITTDFALSMLK